MNNIGLGFEVMAYGLVGVFSVLALFYGVIVGITKVFPVEKE